MAKRKEVFSQREIAATLNNAVLRALRPARLGEIPDNRLRDLRAYAQAIVQPTSEHVDQGLLTYEELVAVLASAALFIHAHHVMGTDKLPMAGKAKDLMEKESA